MREDRGPGTAGDRTPPSGTAFPEAIRRPAAIAGYAAALSSIAVFLCASFLGAAGHWGFVAVYVVLAAVVVAAVVLNLETVIAALSSRRGRAGMSVAVAVASGLMIFFAVNYIAYRHYAVWDITEDRRYTLDAITLRWLERLDRAGQRLRIVTFLPYQPPNYSGLPPDYKARIISLLELYEENCAEIRVTHTDPQLEFARTVEAAASIGINEKSIPTEMLVLKYGEKRKDVGADAMFETSPRPYGGPRGAAVFKGEDALTSAIRDLLDEKPRKVYFLTGHGERGIGSDPVDYGIVAGRLKGMNVEVSTLNLVEKGRVPEDADCVVVAGPTRPFATAETGADELGHLERYLETGGRLLALLDSLLNEQASRPSGLETLLKKYGVEVHQDALALGPEVERFGGLPMVYGLPRTCHDISRPLKGLRAAFFRSACLTVTSAERSGYEAASILEGSQDSWGERRPDRSATYDKEGDVAGPTVLAAAVGPSSSPDRTPLANPAKIVVFADADFASNRLMGDALMRQSINVDLFLNAANWVLERRENIGIVSKEPEKRTVTITPVRRDRLFWGTVVFPIVLTVAFGILVWWKRSR